MGAPPPKKGSLRIIPASTVNSRDWVIVNRGKFQKNRQTRRSLALRVDGRHRGTKTMPMRSRIYEICEDQANAANTRSTSPTRCPLPGPGNGSPLRKRSHDGDEGGTGVARWGAGGGGGGGVVRHEAEKKAQG